MLTKKLLFFSARASPSKIVYFGTLRKVSGSVSRKWISQNSAKGDLLRRQWVERLRRRGVQPPPPPPKSAGECSHDSTNCTADVVEEVVGASYETLVFVHQLPRLKHKLCQLVHMEECLSPQVLLQLRTGTLKKT